MTSLAAARGAAQADDGPAGDGTPYLAERVLGLATRSHASACALLVLLCLVGFLPGQAGLQPMDRDEPRFAQATKQMLETGDLVAIRFQGEARNKKPVGIYWLQAAAVAAGEALGVPRARTTIALYRLPSLLGALAAVLLTYWSALAFLARGPAFLAAALTGTSVLLTAEAHLAKTDAVLTACAAAAMGALARAWLGRGEEGRLPLGTALAFWLAVALGILVKGPMVPMFAGLAALALCVKARSGRWLGRLRPRPGLLLAVAVVLPWFVAITWRSGSAFYAEAVGHDMLGKVGAAQRVHWAPPLTYLGIVFATFFPAAAYVFLAIPFAWRRRGEDAVAFLLAWAVPSWVVLELVPTKLPHYVLPLCPALAILAVLAATRGGLDPERRGSRLVALLVPLVPFGLALGLGIAAWELDRAVPLAGLGLLLVSGGLAVAAWRRFSAGAVVPSMATAVLAASLLGPAALGLVQRDIPALKVSPRLAALRTTLGCPDPATATLGYREPSLVFLTRSDLAMPATGPEAAAFLGAGGCRLLYVEDRQAEDFARAAGAAGLSPHAIGRVEGFNVNGGRRVGLTAYGTP